MTESDLTQAQDSTAMAFNALKASKKELRQLMKRELSDISTASINTQSLSHQHTEQRLTDHGIGEAIFKIIQSLRQYQEAKRIGVYLSMPSSEVQTDAIVRHALQSGKRVFVPYLHKAINSPPNTPKSIMDMVDIRSLSDYESLQRDSWGIPTIAKETVAEREHILENSTSESEGLDMILMPGVAFDLDPTSSYVRRLGHGKGFYDYFIHGYTQSRGLDHSSMPPSGVLLYGLALEEQFLKADDGDAVPVGEYDSLLHGVLVGDGRFVEGPSDHQP